MSQKIKITADSTNDLSPELILKYNIEIIPLYINIKNDSFRDGVDIVPSEIFNYFDNENILAKTSAVPVNDYITIFTKYINEGYRVIHINLSSEMSSSYQNACLAAEEVGNTYIIDSRNLSSGSGHIAILAAELAAKGHDVVDIVDKLNIYTSKVEASFIIDTLTYLHKGGRCSTLAQLGANLLKLKPCIEVVNGSMNVGKKYRGSLEKCLKAYVSERLENRIDIDLDRIFITHSGCNQEILQMVKAQIEATQNFKEVLITNAGCTISSHCGPNTLGILFIRK
ncbi:MAG: domain protein DegV family [Clostridiales bacterium]|jgi:DegV family protein with EDD domain|nr:domain protein DegV family [Clostridiales bacterium]